MCAEPQRRKKNVINDNNQTLQLLNTEKDSNRNESKLSLPPRANVTTFFFFTFFMLNGKISHFPFEWLSHIWQEKDILIFFWYFSLIPVFWTLNNKTTSWGGKCSEFQLADLVTFHFNDGNLLPNFPSKFSISARYFSVKIDKFPLFFIRWTSKL